MESTDGNTLISPIPYYVTRDLISTHASDGISVVETAVYPNDDLVYVAQPLKENVLISDFGPADTHYIYERGIHIDTGTLIGSNKSVLIRSDQTTISNLHVDGGTLIIE